MHTTERQASAAKSIARNVVAVDGESERYRRQNVGQMDVSVTIDDPGAYTKPLTYVQRLALRPETELIEYVCENAQEIGKSGN